MGSKTRLLLGNDGSFFFKYWFSLIEMSFPANFAKQLVKLIGL